MLDQQCHSRGFRSKYSNSLVLRSDVHYWLTSLAILLCCTTTLHAQSSAKPRARPVKETSASAPRAGDVSTRTSHVYVFVGKTGLGHEHAIIGKLKGGAIHLGAKRDAGSLTFDIRSFRADTPEARKYLGLAGETDVDTQSAVTTNMLGPDILNAEKHPEAVFRIQSAEVDKSSARGKGEHYLLVGQFTLRGQTRPLSIPVTVTREESRIRVRGHFALKQTDYGIKPFTKALGVIGVADELRIHGEIDIAAE